MNSDKLRWVRIGTLLIAAALTTLLAGTLSRSDCQVGGDYFFAMVAMLLLGVSIWLSPSGRRMVSGALFFGILVTVFVISSIYWPGLTPRESARRFQCLSNIKALTRAILEYASDHDDRLPLSNSWRSSLHMNLKSVEDSAFDLPPAIDMGTFRCLNSKSFWSYAMNGALSGRRVDGIVDPERTVLLFDADSAIPNASGNLESFVVRDGGKGSVSFVNGHAQPVDLGMAKRLIWGSK